MKILLLLSILSYSVAEIHKSDDVDLLKNGLTELLTTGVAPQYFKDVAKRHQLDLSFSKPPSLMGLSAIDTCDLCGKFVNVVMTMRHIIPEFILKNTIVGACEELKIEANRVCSGVIDPQLDVIFYILKNGKDVKAEKFCTLLLGSSCHNEFDYFNWTIDIPPKPSKLPEKIASRSSKNIRILQVSDLHYDPRYTAGSSAACGEPLCCQDDQGAASDPNDACGIWGDYRNADTSRKVLDEALRHMSTQEVDYVYFTGDIISHRVWSTSEAKNLETEREVLDLLRNTFNVPVLFVLGNHEPHPVNMYAPEEIKTNGLSTKWLFDILAEELKGLISENALKTSEKGGFYTLTLRPGFRVVVLNNNVCGKDNLWLAYDSFDPYGQLTWLVQVLEEAERNGEYVHILHHIPSGHHSCLGTWSREFVKIINRFSETINGQFNGHTHWDEFFLYFDESDPSKATNVAFNGASLTTYSSNNPSYKIYDIDPQNYKVVNFEEWTFNLTAANLQPEKPTVDWYKLYSFRETYGVSSMEPKEINELLTRMIKDKSLLQIYHKYKFRMGSDGYCNDDCHKSNLCRIVTSNVADSYHCDEIMRKYDEQNKLT
ncbi:hypothetical protein WA026_009725 [Henosepilachna vigintioctopunctata]|uniref:Sphingomyelin phosphodiesterase n=1 Tax=Henosepilachna vigintioctopunctata TaxID=420089 RepID=A0AAW1TUE1_9CUCU